MPMLLIDTDVLVRILRSGSWTRPMLKRLALEETIVSIINYGELYLGALKSDRQTDNLARIVELLAVVDIKDVTLPIIERYAALRADLERRGMRLQDFDLLIAATALEFDCTLVTDNLRHFSRVPGLKIENWLV